MRDRFTLSALFALAVIPLCLHGNPQEAASSAEFRRLRDVYTNAVAVIEAKYSGRTKDMPAQYLRELDALGKACQLKGDLKGVLAVKEERERAKGTMGEPGADGGAETTELLALKDKFRGMPADLDRQKRQELDGLAAAYVKHLGELERSLTVRGDFDTAVAVHAEIGRIGSQSATAAAQPQPETVQQADDPASGQRGATARPAEQPQERQVAGPPASALQQKTAAVVPAGSQGSKAVQLTLTGTQKEQDVKLPPGGTYRIDGEYSVPAGMSLEIGPGAALLFKKGASLSVAGTLNVCGTADLPVRFSGQANGSGYWKGIVITGKEESHIEYAKIEGAQEGVLITQRRTCILNSLLTDNVIGIKVGTSGVYDVRPKLENCFITGNKTHGVFIKFATVQLTDCTITRNGGFGVWGIYYPNANLLRSIVTKNAEGGIYGSQYTGVITAHDSFVAENRGAEVVHECDSDWDFSGCWWGDSDTKKLAKSDTANLTGITDSLDGKGKGRVILKDFLTKPPAKCGAALTGVLGKDKAAVAEAESKPGGEETELTGSARRLQSDTLQIVSNGKSAAGAPKREAADAQKASESPLAGLPPEDQQVAAGLKFSGFEAVRFSGTTYNNSEIKVTNKTPRNDITDKLTADVRFLCKSKDEQWSVCKGKAKINVTEKGTQLIKMGGLGSASEMRDRNGGQPEPYDAHITVRYLDTVVYTSFWKNRKGAPDKWEADDALIFNR